MSRAFALVAALLAAVGISTRGEARDFSADFKPEFVLADDADIATMQMNRQAFGLPGDEPTTLARLAAVEDGRASFFEGTPLLREEQIEVENLLQDELVIQQVDQALAAYNGFAGLWIDRNNDRLVNIAFVGPPPESAFDIFDRLVDISHVLVERPFAFSELEADYDRMASALIEAEVVVDTALSLQNAVLEVEGSPISLAAAQSVVYGLQLRVPVTYIIGSPSVGEAAHALFGGLRTADNNNYHWMCTLGLPFVANVGGHPRPTTAQHGGCSHVTHYRATDAVALRITGVDSGPLDTAVLGSIGGSILTDDIIVYQDHQIHAFRDLFGESEPSVGSTVCEAQGSSTRSRCGPVTKCCSGYGNNSGMYRVTMCSQGGDSGSAAYSMVGSGSALGVGNHSGGTDNGATCTSTDRVHIGKVAQIKLAWDLSLKIS